MKYQKNESLLITLIKSGITKENIISLDFSNLQLKEWEAIFELAIQQGVSILAWEAMNLSIETFSIPKNIKITWGLLNEKGKKRYESFCKAANELTQFYKKNEIGTIQMKGVGFSIYYPIPYTREGGDIDIYTYSLNSSTLNDSEANILADKLIQKKGIKIDLHSYKHSSFYYKGIPIENHKYLLNAKSYRFTEDMDCFLFKILNDSREKNHGVMGEKTELLNGAYCIQTPPAEFNTIFLAYHSLQHLGSGLTLHHIVDWAILLQKFGWCMPKEVTDKKFLSYCYALNQLCKDWFGINVDTPNEPEKANLIAQEIFHPKYTQLIPNSSFIGILRYKTGRMIHHHRLVQNFIPCTLRERIWRSLLGHIKNPFSYLYK